MSQGKTIDRKFYIIPNETPICELKCEDAVKLLTPQEKKYAHHISRACFEGGLIVFLQVSPESAGIFVLIHRFFSALSPSTLKEKALAAGWTENEFTSFLIYAAAFLHNGGNYKGFGDTKFVPDVPKGKLDALINSLPEELGVRSVYSKVESTLTSLQPNELTLSFADTGVTTYHSWSITKSDADFIKKFTAANNLEEWNSRLFKEVKDGKPTYYIRYASSEKKVLSTHEYEGATIIVETGDYAPILTRVNAELSKALPFAANGEEKAMLEDYVKHFNSGDINDHKNGSRHWIKDIGPTVESYIGFIENYRDPAGTRSEFEGFATVVNKETSKKFNTLVSQAPVFLQRLPWGPSYEKDQFLKPDFTALEVVTFASSGVPIGINIPNYDEIRQNEGFKNVSLSNVMAAMPKQKLNFLDDADQDIFFKYHKESLEVQVGLHELLGHGSGKLFQKNSDGTFNFLPDTVDIVTGKPVSKWYEPGETWGSKFGALASAYEECRAEAVGYYLCCFPDVLEIFGYTGELAENVKYVNWLSEIRAGLLALEFYSAEAKQWGQAHCYARYVLLKVVLEAAQNFVKIEDKTGEDGQPDLRFTLDRAKIDSVGKPAVNAFLAKLQAYKSTGDFEGGKQLFESYGAVGEQELKWREICIARRKPRRLLLQANTTLNGDQVELKTYPETAEGIIQSFVDRYNKDAVAGLEKVWLDNAQWFRR